MRLELGGVRWQMKCGRLMSGYDGVPLCGRMRATSAGRKDGGWQRGGERVSRRRLALAKSRVMVV